MSQRRRKRDKKIGDYILKEVIGQGAFGYVRIAYHIDTGIKAACKIINIVSLDDDSRIGIKREIAILKQVKHPNIVELYDIVATETSLYIFMEYVSGGEVFDYIVAHNRLKESVARQMMKQMLDGIEYCHNRRIIHRDLKAENLLLDSKRNIKIIDFGLGKVLHGDTITMESKCGSPHYTAPEVYGKGGYGPAVDIWSMGVIMFSLLCGYLPFDDDNMDRLLYLASHEIYEIPSHVSDSARDLIQQMICVDVIRRITIKEIREHPWIKGEETEPVLEKRKSKFVIEPLPSNLVSRIEKMGSNSSTKEEMSDEEMLARLETLEETIKQTSEDKASEEEQQQNDAKKGKKGKEGKESTIKIENEFDRRDRSNSNVPMSISIDQEEMNSEATLLEELGSYDEEDDESSDSSDDEDYVFGGAGMHETINSHLQGYYEVSQGKRNNSSDDGSSGNSSSSNNGGKKKEIKTPKRTDLMGNSNSMRSGSIGGIGGGRRKFDSLPKSLKSRKQLGEGTQSTSGSSSTAEVDDQKSPTTRQRGQSSLPSIYERAGSKGHHKRELRQGLKILPISSRDIEELEQEMEDDEEDEDDETEQDKMSRSDSTVEGNVSLGKPLTQMTTIAEDQESSSSSSNNTKKELPVFSFGSTTFEVQESSSPKVRRISSPKTTRTELRRNFSETNESAKSPRLELLSRNQSVHPSTKKDKGLSLNTLMVNDERLGKDRLASPLRQQFAGRQRSSTGNMLSRREIGRSRSPQPPSTPQEGKSFFTSSPQSNRKKMGRLDVEQITRTFSGAGRTLPKLSTTGAGKSSHDDEGKSSPGQRRTSLTKEYRPGFGAFGSNVCSNKDPNEILGNIQKLLDEMEISWKLKGKKIEHRYTIVAQHKVKQGRKNHSLKYEIEVAELPGLNEMWAVMFKRKKGDTFVYKEQCNSILEALDL